MLAATCILSSLLALTTGMADDVVEAAERPVSAWLVVEERDAAAIAAHVLIRSENEGERLIRLKTIEYNRTFEVERHATVDLYWKGDRSWAMIRRPEVVPGNATGRIRNSSGKLYRVEKADAQRWIFHEDQFRYIDDAHKTCDMRESPGFNLLAKFLPGLRWNISVLIGSADEEWLADCDWRMVHQRARTLRVMGMPKSGHVFLGIASLELLIDRAEGRLSAVQMVDASGAVRTVWIVNEQVLNPDAETLRESFGDDPFSPELEGYLQH